VRLRRKITAAFFLVSTLVAVLLAVVLYRFIERQLASELRARLRDMAQIAAAEVEVEPYQRLLAHLGDGSAAVPALEAGADYKELSDHLNMVRRAEPSLVHFIYLLAPTGDPHTAKFVVDADVLDFHARLARGEQLPHDQDKISEFGDDYDVSEFPRLQQALTDCTAQYEKDFVWDDDYGVASVSAYVPLTDDNGTVLRGSDGTCLGVLGVDITDAEMRAALDEAGGLALRISIAVVIVALLVSIAMGTVLTRSILALSNTVKRFAAKDFAARTEVAHAHDEVGQLGTNFNAMAETIQIHNEQLEDLVAQRTRELADEKATSERLLLNVLPAPIAGRLLKGESLIVDRFDSVSVLFADIVGFTKLSSHTSPEKLVTMLNDVFSAFDRLAEQHGLEKIKTIGDAYMVVAGVPVPSDTHATAMAAMALDMLDVVSAYAAKTETELSIRIGVHTGPVVAGVIGKNKFIYDLWGDTVNTASRMESHGVPGRVHVTEQMRALLDAAFTFEDRGTIEVKGKGLMQTFLLMGRRG
jgi:class 3 adenylate cyclase